MTEVRVTERSNEDRGEARNGRCDVDMDVAMDMATTTPSVTVDTAGSIISESMVGNKNRKQRQSNETPANASAPSDWRSRIERTMPQQAKKRMKLHRTVGRLANLLEARAAREEAQWLGTMMWMQEREQKWDACHENDKLWGAGIMNLIAKTMNGVAPGQAV